MYKIFGADGKEYGPVDGNEMRKWIVEGRVNANTQVLPQGAAAWGPAASVPEFSGLFTAAPALLPLAGKPQKTSGLAIASLVLGILGFCTVGTTALIGLILGIVGLVKINKSQGQVGGKNMAIAGLCVSGAAILMLPILAGMMLPALANAKDKAQTIRCVNNVKQLALALRMYANDNNDTYPKAEKWCDAILNEAGTPTIFVCPGANDGQRSHYAFNAKLSGKKEGDVHPETVMIFECAGGWNISGGKDNAEKHHRRTYVVGFADGSVRQISEGRIESLRWDP